MKESNAKILMQGCGKAFDNLECNEKQLCPTCEAVRKSMLELRKEELKRWINLREGQKIWLTYTLLKIEKNISYSQNEIKTLEKK
jgi:hypothetical protein